MLQGVQTVGGADLGGGLTTLPNLFALKPNQTPHSMNVKFNLGGSIEKRLGSNTLNAVTLVASSASGFNPTAGTEAVGLSAFWPMDEQSGTRFDAFGANNLTDVFGNIGFVAGLVGNAASCAAINTGGLLAVNDPSLQTGGNIPFSAQIWVYFYTTADQAILYKGDLNITASNEYLFDFISGRFRFLVGNSTTSVTVTANSFGAPTTATWYHVVGVYDSANSFARIFVNLSQNSSNYTGGGWNSTYPMLIGGTAGGTGESGNASYDMAGMWKNKALSNAEISNLYNSGNGNTYVKGASVAGWGAFDFGAGTGADGKPLRWLVVAAGTGIYASSNRGTTFVTIATDRSATYQYFERSKSFLIACSESNNRILYWAGSAGTSMLGIAVGSAPPAKHALDFQGFLFLMNDTTSRRLVTYADNNTIATNAWNNSFELPSSYDDEITDGIILNKKSYVFTKYKVFRISYVGGNPDFGYQEVKGWGAVPGTVKKITLSTFPYIGEYIIALGYDKKLRIFDGAEDLIISDLVEQSNDISPFALSNLNVDALLNSRAEVDTNEQVYKLVLAVSPSSQTTTLLNYNYRLGAFYTYDSQPFNAMVMADSGASRILVGVGRDGRVHQMGTGYLDGNSSPVLDYYQSPLFYSQTPRHVQKGAKIDLYFSPTSSGSLYYQDRVNFSSVFGAARQVMAFDNTGGVHQLVQTIDIPVTSNVYQFQISSSGSTAAPWRLNRYDYYSADKGVGKA